MAHFAPGQKVDRETGLHLVRIVEMVHVQHPFHSTPGVGGHFVNHIPALQHLRVPGIRRMEKRCPQPENRDEPLPCRDCHMRPDSLGQPQFIGQLGHLELSSACHTDKRIVQNFIPFQHLDTPERLPRLQVIGSPHHSTIGHVILMPVLLVGVVDSVRQERDPGFQVEVHLRSGMQFELESQMQVGSPLVPVHERSELIAYPRQGRDLEQTPRVIPFHEGCNIQQIVGLHPEACQDFIVNLSSEVPELHCPTQRMEAGKPPVHPHPYHRPCIEVPVSSGDKPVHPPEQGNADIILPERIESHFIGITVAALESRIRRIKSLVVLVLRHGW